MGAITSEKDAKVLIPVEKAGEIFDGIVEGSTVLNVFDRLPNMGSKTKELTVLDALGHAEFTGEKVTDDLTYGEDSEATHTPLEGPAGLKETTYMKWKNVKIIAETLAIILPVPREVLNDSQFDIWEAMKPRVIEAMGKRIDEAILWGKRRPVSWASGIVPTAIARGNVVAQGSGVDFAEDVSNLMGLIEQYGFDPTLFLAGTTAKKFLRTAKDANGNLLFAPGVNGTPDTLWGVNVDYGKNGSFNQDFARLLVGDMKQAKYAIREDLEFQIADTGVITNEYGEIEINLFQENVRALRVEMRLGWALPNPIHQLNPDREGYPFAVMTK